MLAVFVVTYINYGIMQFMACFDVRNANDNLAQIFKGLYADFNSLWYNDVGVSITSIMVSNMYWPLLEMVIFTGLRIGYRMID